LNLDPKEFIEVDPRYFRPAEVDSLMGDPSKIRKKLGWEPEISFDEMVDRMVSHDMELARQEKTLRDGGHVVMSGASHT
jgi:GDPmannose 4,6-dehydratase